MLRGKMFFLKIMGTLLVLGMLIQPPGGRQVLAASWKTPKHDNVVISEVRSRGPNGTNDEFVELFNPTTSTISIGGWTLYAANGNTSFSTPLYTFPGDAQLESGQHTLIANNGTNGYSGGVTPDGTYTTPAIPDDGGVALMDNSSPNPKFIDLVGTIQGTPFEEGIPLFHLTTNTNQSYERGPGGSLGNCTDTDNNSTDFKLIAPPNPQNLFSPYTTTCTDPLQSISFTSIAPAAAAVGGGNYTPTALATSGLAVALTIDASSSTICSISTGSVSFNSTGTCLIDANQGGDPPGPNFYYSPAAQVTQSIPVNKGTQTISFTSSAPSNARVGGPTYSPTAAGGGSGNPVVLTIDAGAAAVCMISGSTVSFIGIGNCTIDANQAGNSNWNAADQVQQSFPVAIGSQTITFGIPAPVGAGVGGSYTPGATATSGLSVTITIDASAATVCSIGSGGLVTFNTIGTCVVDAAQPGDANWNPAPLAQQSFPIKNNQTITFASIAPSSGTVGGPIYTPDANASSGLPVIISIDAAAASVCSISSGSVYFNSTGTCLVDANQAGSDIFNAAPQVQQSIPVNLAATATPTAPTHIVISEFRSRGPLGANDEFVEIYNPYAAAINIGSWTIRASSGCGTTITVLVTFTTGTILKPGQHYLVAATGSSVAGEADRTFTPGIDDNGGVGLFNYVGTVQDMAGMCASTTFREGNFLAPLLQINDPQNESYERKPVGATSCYDNNDNLRDFALVQPADPQNSDSPIVMCTGVTAFTPTFTPTPSKTRTPTIAPTIVPGNVVLNEFLPHPRSDWNADGKVDTGDEYIEIINMGTVSINVANWKLDNGAGSANSFTLPNLTLLPRQIAVFFHADTGIGLNDMGSSVRLLKPDGHTADIFNYPLVTAADRTWCRLPDGNGAWGFTCYPTPGKPNQAIKSGGPGAGTGGLPGSICIKNSAPETVLTAECNSPGGQMTAEGENGEVWLKSRLKFDVFVE